jgi:phosphoheptose isomerase
MPVSELRKEDAARLREAGVKPAEVAQAATALITVLRGGGKLLAFGNGGSAADAQHIAAELVGRFERERRALPALALTTDSSAMTAIANDYGFEQVFARQVEALGSRGDIALAISTSGSSANVLNGVHAARRAGVITIGLCGAPGCELCGAVDIPIAVAPDKTATVQEAHLRVEHALCRTVEQTLFEDGEPAASAPRGSVVSLAELMALRDEWKAAGRVLVWTNGCFDILHRGHLASVEAARDLGDILVVGVNSDESVRRLKGEGRPLVPAADRAALIAALRPVDYAVVFDDDTPERVLGELRPEIHCKGADYAHVDPGSIPERAVVESYGGRVEFLPLLRDRSTSSLVASLRQGSA